jgi:hypothetical protein
VTVIGQDVLILNVLLLAFVSFLVHLSFPGDPRNNILYHDLLPRLSIDPWLHVLVNLLDLSSSI